MLVVVVGSSGRVGTKKNTSLLACVALRASVPVCLFAYLIYLCSLATPQSHSLAVFLEFRDQLIALLDDVLVLLVLVVRAVRLDDALARDAVDGAGDAAACYELGQVTIYIEKKGGWLVSSLSEFTTTTGLKDGQMAHSFLTVHTGLGSLL